jgi:hypothetical protein
MQPSTTSQIDDAGAVQEPPDLAIGAKNTETSNPISTALGSTSKEKDASIQLDQDEGITGKGASKPMPEEKSAATENCENVLPIDSSVPDVPRRRDYFAGIFGRQPSFGGRSISSLSGFQTVKRKVTKFAKFVGPGFLVSVAYIDPGILNLVMNFINGSLTLIGNYATDVAAGASFRYKLLFMVLVSNMIAVFLQSLCIKLGTVTGLNLAENCRAHLPKWLNYVLYGFAEAAIIATDIAEVRNSFTIVLLDTEYHHRLLVLQLLLTFFLRYHWSPAVVWRS